MFSILLYSFAGLFLLWMILLSLGVRRMWLNVVLFGLEATIAYTIIGNLVPQIESRPQAELQLSPDATPEQLVKAGEQLFYGKGTCALCHSIDPSEAARCPQLGAGPLGPAIGGRADERLKEAGYKGKAKDGTEYLIESLVHPQDHLVQGFPPMMPVINKPPIGLNNDEIAAVVAFLQSIQGGKVTVTPKLAAAFTGTEAPAQPGTATAQPVVASATNRPSEQLIAELACIACHKFDEPGPLVGPSLWDVGARKDDAYIRQSILDPNAVIAEGFPPMLMPPDLGQKMTGWEFEHLVQWLSEHKGAKGQ
ncbi:MAG TPA: c-type cytochrome [Candidatus Tectomicrobia bacterium]